MFLRSLGAWQVERLYDFFLASHPLMSLYFAVSLMHGQRAQLLKTDGDYAEVHRIMQVCVFVCVRARVLSAYK